MKSLNDFKISIMEKRQDTIVYTFGRFQPPTSGHQLLIDKVISVAKKQGAEHRIYPSVSNDPKKNPLSHTDKVKFMKQMFKKANIVNDKKIITPFHAAKQLSDQGYKNVTLIVGGDRVADLRKQITQYINHKDPKKAFYFDSFKVVSAGKRDPDSSDISGMSASKMRKAVSDKDFDLFMKGMPDSVSKTAAKKLYNAIAKGMNLKEDRDYEDEYEKHHASPEQRARRISRTVTRKKAERKGRVSKGDEKDIDHKDHNPHNDSPSNLSIKSKASNRSDNGHKPGEKQKQHEETEVDELTIAQRRNISRAAKKTAKKRLKTRLRKKKQKKGTAEIKKKAGKEAINILKKKFLKGKNYADLPHSQKEKIDARLKKIPKARVQALTKKMLVVAREKERNRIKSLRGATKEEKIEPKDREMGTPSLTNAYADETPGQSIKGKKMKSFEKFNEAKNPKIKGKFTKSQLDQLRNEYSKISKIDPSNNSYKKLTGWLDSMNIDQIKQLVDAKIKFISGLAFNRFNRMQNPKNYPSGKLGESTMLDEAWTSDSVIRNAEIGSKKGYGITIKKGLGVTKTPYKHMLMTMRRDKSVRVTFDHGKDEFEGTPKSVALYVNKILGIKESVELDEGYLEKIKIKIGPAKGKIVFAGPMGAPLKFDNQAKAKKTAGRVEGKVIKAGNGEFYIEVPTTTKKEEVELDEISPPGFEGTVKAMKKHSEVDNPYALAWYMKKKGFKSHKKKDGSDKK